MIDAAGAIYVIGGFISTYAHLQDVWVSSDGGARPDSVWGYSRGYTGWYAGGYSGGTRGYHGSTKGVRRGSIGVLRSTRGVLQGTRGYLRQARLSTTRSFLYPSDN